ncbi:MAG: sigma 54-interacting transcriptional regulator [Deltaproteobacteria bacterium]|nr:sigma 54-interacting transcriptional regulator [Deltaproteobacteria bacterium]
MPTAVPLFQDRYRLLRVAGRGTFGRVFEAFDVQAGEPRALKVVPAGAHEALLCDEYEQLARLRHPSLPRVFEVGRVRAALPDHGLPAGAPFFAAEWIAGEHADARVWDGNVVDLWALLADACGALATIHAAGLVHADVAPQNLLVAEGRVVLVDLGLATRFADDGTPRGTPAYMAPEAFAGRLDPRSDLYGLAATVVRIVGGRAPFDVPSLGSGVRGLGELVQRILTAPTPVLHQLPRGLADLLARMLARDPAARPASALAVLDELDQLAPVIAPSISRHARPRVGAPPAPAIWPGAAPWIDAVAASLAAAHAVVLVVGAADSGRRQLVDAALARRQLDEVVRGRATLPIVAGSLDQVASALDVPAAASARAWLECAARAMRGARARVVVELGDDPRAGELLAALARAGGDHATIAIVDDAPAGRELSWPAVATHRAPALDDAPAGREPSWPAVATHRAPAVDDAPAGRELSWPAVATHRAPTLDVDGIASLASAMLDGTPPRSWCAGLLAASDGQPLAAIELMRSLALTADPFGVDWSARTSAGVVELRARTLRATADGPQALAAAIAVCGGRMRVEHALAVARAASASGRFGDARVIGLGDIVELERLGLVRRHGAPAAVEVAMDRATRDAVRAVFGAPALAELAGIGLAALEGTGRARELRAALLERGARDGERAAEACDVAEQLLACGRADRALGLARRAFATAPARAHLVAARAMAATGAYREAVDHAHAARDAGADPIEADLVAARALQRAADLDAAESVLARLHAAHPDHAEVAGTYARLLVTRSRYVDARSVAIGAPPRKGQARVVTPPPRSDGIPAAISDDTVRVTSTRHPPASSVLGATDATPSPADSTIVPTTRTSLPAAANGAMATPTAVGVHHNSSETVTVGRHDVPLPPPSNNPPSPSSTSTAVVGSSGDARALTGAIVHGPSSPAIAASSTDNEANATHARASSPAIGLASNARPPGEATATRAAIRAPSSPAIAIGSDARTDGEATAANATVRAPSSPAIAIGSDASTDGEATAANATVRAPSSPTIRLASSALTDGQATATNATVHTPPSSPAIRLAADAFTDGQVTNPTVRAPSSPIAVDSDGLTGGEATAAKATVRAPSSPTITVDSDALTGGEATAAKAPVHTPSSSPAIAADSDTWTDGQATATNATVHTPSSSPAIAADSDARTDGQATATNPTVRAPSSPAIAVDSDARTDGEATATNPTVRAPSSPAIAVDSDALTDGEATATKATVRAPSSPAFAAGSDARSDGEATATKATVRAPSSPAFAAGSDALSDGEPETIRASSSVSASTVSATSDAPVASSVAPAPLAGLRAESAGLAAFYLGELDEADAAFAALELGAAAANDSVTVGRALSLRGMVAQQRGQLGLASDRYREAARRLADAGELHAAATAELNLGTVLAERGRASDALPRLAAAGRVFAELGATTELVAAELNRGNALLAVGQLDDARLAAESALARSENTPHLRAFALLVGGDVRRRLGDDAGAVRAYRDALAIGVERGDAHAQISAYIALAEAGHSAGAEVDVEALCASADDRDRWTLARCRLALRDPLDAGAALALARQAGDVARRAADGDRLERAFRGHALAAQLAARARADVERLPGGDATDGERSVGDAAARADGERSVGGAAAGRAELVAIARTDGGQSAGDAAAGRAELVAIARTEAERPARDAAVGRAELVAIAPTERPAGNAAAGRAELVAIARIDGERSAGDAASGRAELVTIARTEAERAHATHAALVAAAAPAFRAALDGDGDRQALLAAVPREVAATAPRGSDSGMRRLLALSRRLNSEASLERILDEAIDTAIELTSAERGFLLLRQPDGELAPVVSRNFIAGDLEGGPSVSRSIAERAAQTGEPVVTIDAGVDERFGAAASVAALRLRSVLAVPLRQRGTVTGCIYVDHRLRGGAFNDAAAGVLGELADIAAIAIENARLADNLRRSTREVAELNARLSAELAERDAELVRVRADLPDRDRLRHRYERIVGRSPAMVRMLDIVDRAAATSLPVVIVGESGTGKELVARALHDNGPRREGPFVALNCSAVPEPLLESELFGHVRGSFTGADRDRRGLFEVADGGTLFLDEIADTGVAMQAKLLRVLQDGVLRRVGDAKTRRVDVRVIAASQHPLVELVAANRFREDLRFRLEVITVPVPALRDRDGDIPLLVERLLTHLCPDRPSPRITRAASRALGQHRWPGNVRELQNALARGLAMGGDVIDLPDLPESIASTTGRPEPAKPTHPDDLRLRPALAATEHAYIAAAMTRAKNNQTVAARLLGLSRFGLQKKLRRLSDEE